MRLRQAWAEVPVGVMGEAVRWWQAVIELLDESLHLLQLGSDDLKLATSQIVDIALG